jgi:hypothetical protein
MSPTQKYRIRGFCTRIRPTPRIVTVTIAHVGKSANRLIRDRAFSMSPECGAIGADPRHAGEPSSTEKSASRYGALSVTDQKWNR